MEGFDEESWGDLVNLVGHAHLCVLFCADIPTDLPTGWTLKERGEGRQMIVDPYQLKAVEPVVSRLLTPVDIPQMLDLVGSPDLTIPIGHSSVGSLLRTLQA